MAIKTRIEDMQIGDKIICDFSANKSGAMHGASFYNLGNFKNIEADFIDIDSPNITYISGVKSGSEFTKGRFYFVMLGWDYRGRRILVADRILKTNISYQDLNEEGFIYGKRQNTLLLKNECTLQDNFIGISYEGRNKAFNKAHGGYSANAWEGISPTLPNWLGQNFKERKKIVGYSIASLSDYEERMPTDWYFQASDDGKEWETLSQEKVGSWTAEKRYFEVPHEKQDYYKYYRLYFNKIDGWAIISEVEMFESEKVNDKYNFYIRSLRSSVNSITGDITNQKYLIDSGHYSNRDKAFDRRHGAYKSYAWQSESTQLPIWLGQKFPKKNKIISYSIACNTEMQIDSSPIKWNFEGSNDGENWDVLDEQIKEISDWTRESFLFNISKEKQNYYTHYRINILEKTENSSILISELKMYSECDFRNSEYHNLLDFNPNITKQEYLIDTGSYKGYNKVFDKNHGQFENYGWQGVSHIPPCWIGQKFEEAKKITDYYISILGDAYWDRMPSKWKFEGSNDGQQWELLSSDTHNWVTNRLKYFKVPKEKQDYYTHYRLYFDEFPKANSPVISEIGMYENGDPLKWNEKVFNHTIFSTMDMSGLQNIINSEIGAIAPDFTQKNKLGFRPVLLVEEKDIKRYLIYKDNQYKSISSDGRIIDVEINSFDDFKEHGMSNLKNLFISTGINRPIDLLDDKFEIKAISKENIKLKIKIPPMKAIDKLENKDIKILQKSKDNIDKSIEIKAKPKSQIVIQKEDIDLSSVESVDKINIKTVGNGGKIKIAISGDSGQRWVVNKSGSWQEISLKDIKDAGMDVNKLCSLTKEELGIILTNNTLKIAYYIEYDDIESDYGIDNLQMQVDMRGVWKKARHYNDYDYEYASNTKLRVYIKTDGTYKINYPA